MGRWSRTEIEAAFENFQKVALRAGTSGDWDPWADMFTEKTLSLAPASAAAQSIRMRDAAARCRLRPAWLEIISLDPTPNE